MTQAERTVLGGALMFGVVPDLTADHFSDGEGRQIWRALEGCLERDLIPNPLNVSMVDKSLNASTIATLTEDAPIGNDGYYIAEVRKEYKTRQLKRLAKTVAEKAGDPDDAIQAIEAELSRITGLSSDVHHSTLVSAMKEALAVAEKRYHSEREIPGITTGLRKIDGMTMGMEPGELWLVGARPSVGKSAILLNMALNAAAKNERVGYALLEDSGSALGRRALAVKSGVNAMQIATGNLGAGEFAKLTAGVAELVSAKFELLVGYSGLQIAKLLQSARSLKRSHNIGVLYVDYLQLLNGPGDSKHERIAYVTEALKALAMQLEIPVVAAAQLRRDSEGRKPTLADFSDSSELEKAANVALLLHKLEGETDTSRELCIYAEKVRDGMTGYVKTVFHKQYLRIREEAE